MLGLIQIDGNDIFEQNGVNENENTTPKSEVCTRKLDTSGRVAPFATCFVSGKCFRTVKFAQNHSDIFDAS